MAIVSFLIGSMAAFGMAAISLAVIGMGWPGALLIYACVGFGVPMATIAKALASD